MCFTFIYLGINKEISEKERHQLLNNQVGNSILLKNQSDEMKHSFAEQVHELENFTGQDNTLSYANIRPLIIQKGNDYISFYFIVANTPFLNHYVHTEESTKTVFISEALNKVVQTNQELSVIDASITFQNQNILLGNHALKKELFTPNHVFQTLVTSTTYLTDVDLTYSMILTNEAYQTLKDTFFVSFTQTFCSVNNQVDIQQFMTDVSRHSELPKLEAVAVVPEFKKGTESLMEFLNVFSWASYIALSIVVTGVVGVLLIFLEKRKKRQMISLIFGATPLQLILELGIELFMLTGLSSVLAALCCWWIQPYISTAYYLIQFSKEGIVVAIVLPIAISLLALMLCSGYFIQLKYIKGVKHYE
ncbi:MULTISPECIES: hypothetical protein [unclassified Granulicatella]|uniref:FtsX-like permease family protein n=1 Tax=unclassified Granulicatella TaxID=2630493 RepID=UPI0010744E1B|nr:MULTISPECIES: hypothetical protein [unclassified Granulicatella]MBF0780957.1 hypothetical protein [Granulicatella sp. 19428wC4_WM01]TFU92977.1 hypothetical protein E4T68_07555 [Granulicatella sp. WM01]